MKRKNGRKICVWCWIPQVIVLLYTIFVLPFIVNGFSFSYLREAVFWLAILPMMIIIPLSIFCFLEDKKLETIDEEVKEEIQG